MRLLISTSINIKFGVLFVFSTWHHFYHIGSNLGVRKMLAFTPLLVCPCDHHVDSPYMIQFPFLIKMSGLHKVVLQFMSTSAPRRKHFHKTQTWLLSFYHILHPIPLIFLHHTCLIIIKSCIFLVEFESSYILPPSACNNFNQNLFAYNKLDYFIETMMTPKN